MAIHKTRGISIVLLVAIWCCYTCLFHSPTNCDARILNHVRERREIEIPQVDKVMQGKLESSQNIASDISQLVDDEDHDRQLGTRLKSVLERLKRSPLKSAKGRTKLAQLPKTTTTTSTTTTSTTEKTQVEKKPTIEEDYGSSGDYEDIGPSGSKPSSKEGKKTQKSEKMAEQQAKQEAKEEEEEEETEEIQEEGEEQEEPPSSTTTKATPVKGRSQQPSVKSKQPMTGKKERANKNGASTKQTPGSGTTRSGDKAKR